jgi:hypothetical protein
MMRSIAIGLAAATIAIGGSTLSVSALHGQESGISKGSMSGSVKGHQFGTRTYNEERGHGNRAELTPRARERLREIARERYAELTPRQRERLTRIGRERHAELTPPGRERLYRHGPYGRR